MHTYVFAEGSEVRIMCVQIGIKNGNEQSFDANLSVLQGTHTNREMFYREKLKCFDGLMDLEGIGLKLRVDGVSSSSSSL